MSYQPKDRIKLIESAKGYKIGSLGTIDTVLDSTTLLVDMDDPYDVICVDVDKVVLVEKSKEIPVVTKKISKEELDIINNKANELLEDKLR